MTTTSAWFFAAARIIAGPPMSMFSTISSNAAARRSALLERIEVDDEQIDRRDAVGDHRRLMRGIGAHGEQAAMDARVQRLQPPVHHFREPGELGDVDDGDARLRQAPRRCRRWRRSRSRARRGRGRARSIRSCRRRKSARGRRARGDRWPLTGLARLEAETRARLITVSPPIETPSSRLAPRSGAASRPPLQPRGEEAVEAGEARRRAPQVAGQRAQFAGGVEALVEAADFSRLDRNSPHVRVAAQQRRDLRPRPPPAPANRRNRRSSRPAWSARPPCREAGSAARRAPAGRPAA